MNRPESLSTADVGDRHRRLMALALLAIGCLYSFSALGHLVEPGMTGVLENLESLMAVTMLGLVLPIVWWKIRAPRAEWSLYQGRDGFVEDSLSRAHKASWIATFLVLVVTDSFVETSAGRPASFYLDVAIAVMLVVFSSVFLYLSRSSAEEDLEEDSDA